MKDQINTIRKFIEHCGVSAKLDALDALTQLEAMVGKQEPVYQGALAENVWIDLDKEAHDNWVANKGKVRTTYIAPVAQQPQAEKRCEYCDGTGDVHGFDGEWRGECHCCKQPQAEAVPPGFEVWLRTVCFQRPTPEAYDLAKAAWSAAIAQQKGQS